MNARRLILSGFATALGVLVCAGAPALAAAAEAPKMEEESVSSVASTSATFNALVNPEGAATTYTFEYAPAGGSFKPVPEAEGSGSLPEGMAGVALSVHVQGLLPSAAYEFRLVASNSVEKVIGESVSFAMQLGGGEFALPDGRQYEMVTPPEKEGALFYGLRFPGEGLHGAIQASADGDAIVDQASQPTEAEPQGYAETASVLSSRGPGGWSSRVIAPPRDVVSTVTQGSRSEDLLFSEDLSRGLVQQLGPFEPLSPEASESTPYLRTVDFNGNTGKPCDAPALGASSCFRPIVSRADDTASPFEPFGGGPDPGEAHCESQFCGPALEGGSPDLSHVIVKSRAQLTLAPVHTEYGGLYEWFDGRLQLVSVFPKGEEDTEGRATLAGGGDGGPAGYAGGGNGVERAVSEDGERVIFVDIPNGESEDQEGGIYLRDVAKDETALISAKGRYMTASSDASKVFFLSGGKSEVLASAGNLEMFEVTSGENEPLAGRVTDLTVDPHAGESAGVLQVLGATDDGSYMYFAAAGALTANATPASECSDLQEKSGCNIYMYHDGVTSLVAAGWYNDGNGYWARVSPNGRWLAFMSARDLTGYDTREALGGHADAEVYLYDASTGELACASCDPNGERPVGEDDEGKGDFEGEPGWVAANVPARLRTFGFYGNSPSRYQSRYLSDSGRLFFETIDSLVPQDVNGVGDVYEYEPEGVPAGEHACGALSSSGSEVYKSARVFEVGGRSGVEGAGCVALVSSGTSSEPSLFLDASESGGDAFFLTTARLAPQDVDTAKDVYDAHECMSGSPCVAPVVQSPPCDTEASCRVAPLAQPAIFGVPPSATFSGSGNVTGVPSPAPVKSAKRAARCGRGLVKRKGRCVKAKRRRERARKASGAGHEGRSR